MRSLDSRYGEKQDITINLYHLVEFDGRRFTATIANAGEIIHFMDELVLAGTKCLGGGRTVWGEYQVVVLSNKVQLKLVIRRNLTILQGNGATGETTLLEPFDEFDRVGPDSKRLNDGVLF